MAARLRVITGKRYIRRDGSVSGVILYMGRHEDYPFFDPENHHSFSRNGKSWRWHKLPEDLIAPVDVVHKEDITEWL